MQQQPDPPSLARRLFALAGALVLSGLYLAWAIDPDAAHRWIPLLSALPVFALSYLVFDVLYERAFLEAAHQESLAPAGSVRRFVAVLLTPVVLLLGMLLGILAARTNWGTGTKSKR